MCLFVCVYVCESLSVCISLYGKKFSLMFVWEYFGV